MLSKKNRKAINQLEIVSIDKLVPKDHFLRLKTNKMMIKEKRVVRKN
ncbi:hypothetical protein SAMN02745221_02170 [Thermosyntropha lipolytica DSM 11003]|uniref:Uncharacterized protein n=1 Tax=Thermosyntropha lipolytica DSM 11003 TaxID=1123382 RepID=A0A1M5S5F6_9FIRM|nr:hypothetical protein [Thermosyntropha lipolytica]SHH33716.1 hypothetical protein SAMN02745221_02170 [Thermosyntropha lipolytica DSM 11003]